MSAPLLTPLDSPIFDEDVVAGLEEHSDDVPMCECPQGCDQVATARFVVLCGCPRVALGCDLHIASTREFFASSKRCSRCGSLVAGYRVVPL